MFIRAPANLYGCHLGLTFLFVSTLNCPMSCDVEINLTVGVYQIKLAPCYVQEHMDEDGIFEVFVCNIDDSLLCAKSSQDTFRQNVTEY